MLNPFLYKRIILIGFVVALAHSAMAAQSTNGDSPFSPREGYSPYIAPHAQVAAQASSANPFIPNSGQEKADIQASKPATALPPPTAMKI